MVPTVPMSFSAGALVAKTVRRASTVHARLFAILAQVGDIDPRLMVLRFRCRSALTKEIP